jgi:hypothetical protein
MVSPLLGRENLGRENHRKRVKATNNLFEVLNNPRKVSS